MVWQVGNRVADGEEAERKRVFEAGEAIAGSTVKAEVLYGESDGNCHINRDELQLLSTDGQQKLIHRTIKLRSGWHAAPTSFNLLKESFILMIAEK